MFVKLSMRHCFTPVSAIIVFTNNNYLHRLFFTCTYSHVWYIVRTIKEREKKKKKKKIVRSAYVYNIYIYMYIRIYIYIYTYIYVYIMNVCICIYRYNRGHVIFY